MDFINDEIPKYKKKSQKTIKKSNHRHTYKPCLLYDVNRDSHHKSEYCTICGKIGETKFFESAETVNGFSRGLTQEELLQKYKDLEIKDILDLFKDKYVSI